MLRWFFFVRRERRLTWRDVLPGLVLLASVAIVNSTCQQRGLYEQLEWADLDRLQRTAAETGGAGISLILIDDEDYERVFDATSPLAADSLVALIAAACRYGPTVVGVDILTSDWPADFHDEVAAPRLAGCRVVWISDVLASATAAGHDAPALRLGRTVGADAPPAGVCVVASVLRPDDDGVIRRYSTWYPAAAHAQGSDPLRQPTLVAALAAHDTTCLRPTPLRPGETHDNPKIRFSSNARFPRLPARYLFDAAAEPGGQLDRSTHELLADRIVIIGGAYRHARDQHRTPIGFIHGAELIANAVHTELAAPIADVRWWQSLLVDLLVGTMLLVGITWARLRWPWASLASFVLTAFAALMISWLLHNYLGYFLGVLGGLMGVVLSVLASVVWEPLRDMWKGWLREYPRAQPPRPNAGPAAAATPPGFIALPQSAADADPARHAAPVYHDTVGRSE